MRLTKILYLIAVGILFSFAATAQKQQVWIDADTGNEMDDVYALVRLIGDPSVDIIGLSSAHFNNPDLLTFEMWNQYPTSGINTVQISQQLNQELLELMGKAKLPHPTGADRQMGRAWGGTEVRKSEAAEMIITSVEKLGNNQKLMVICLGALTNVASAIALKPAIADKITIYALGAKYDFKGRYWNKSEFNIRNDLNAFDYLLNNSSVDMVMMPVNVVQKYQFKKDSVYRVLDTRYPLQNLLKKRWEETNPQDAVRTLWDLALVQAFLKPQLSSIESVDTPPENTSRKVRVYSNIDVQGMKDDFFRELKKIDKK